MIRIALDAMSGDFGPDTIVPGALEALKDFDDLTITLFGDKEVLEALTADTDTSRLTIVHTTEIITDEDDPMRSIRKKKDASVVQAARAVKNSEADVFVSAGNSGASLACGVFIVGLMGRVKRPGIMALRNSTNPERPYFAMLDLGANTDVRAESVLQFAQMANEYMINVMNIEAPLIGLLSNGSEDRKGNELNKKVFPLLQDNATLNFYGNIEASNLFKGLVDIVVTDGFSGNLTLKSMEGTYATIIQQLNKALDMHTFESSTDKEYITDTLNKLNRLFDTREIGGGLIIGVAKPMVICHAASDSYAIKNAIKQARKFVVSNTIAKIEKVL